MYAATARVSLGWSARVGFRSSRFRAQAHECTLYTTQVHKYIQKYLGTEVFCANVVLLCCVVGNLSSHGPANRPVHLRSALHAAGGAGWPGEGGSCLPSPEHLDILCVGRREAGGGGDAGRACLLRHPDTQTLWQCRDGTQQCYNAPSPFPFQSSLGPVPSHRSAPKLNHQWTRDSLRFRFCFAPVTRLLLEPANLCPHSFASSNPWLRSNFPRDTWDGRLIMPALAMAHAPYYLAHCSHQKHTICGRRLSS
jgi:hypothetical protein